MLFFQPEAAASDLPLGKVSLNKDSDVASFSLLTSSSDQKKTAKSTAGSRSGQAAGKSKTKSLQVSPAKSAGATASAKSTEDSGAGKSKEPFKFVQVVSEDQTQYVLTEEDKKVFEEFRKSK